MAAGLSARCPQMLGIGRKPGRGWPAGHVLPFGAVAAGRVHLGKVPPKLSDSLHRELKPRVVHRQRLRREFRDHDLILPVHEQVLTEQHARFASQNVPLAPVVHGLPGKYA